MATRIIDDSKLQGIAVAIQSKDNGGQMTVDEMPGRIEAIPTGQTGGRIIYSDFDEDGLPRTIEYVPASESDTKLPDRFISYGHPFSFVTWHSKIEKIICPNHVTELGEGGFSVNRNYKKLSNYDFLEIVGTNAFSGTVGKWDYDYLPLNLKYIGVSGFSNDPLKFNTFFQIPDTVEYIGTGAFQYYSLSRDEAHLLSLPLSLKYIGNNAFYNNGVQLFPEEIVIPYFVETIGNHVFGGGGFLTKTITFRGTPTTILPEAFLSGVSTGTMRDLVTINVPWAEGEVANAPWGAVNATINYNYSG